MNVFLQVLTNLKSHFNILTQDFVSFNKTNTLLCHILNNVLFLD